MKSLVNFVFLLAVSFASVYNLRRLGNDTLQQNSSMPAVKEKEVGIYSRITHGLYARDDQFPYLVGLRTWYEGGENMICGGSLISDEWVLTAAHCTIDGINVDVHLGSTIFDSPRLRYLRVHRNLIKEHEDYDTETFHHDIGLIQTPQIRLRHSINIVQLPPPDFPAFVGITAYVAGWGDTSDSAQTHSSDLMYHTFKVVKNCECSTVFDPRKIYRGKLCTESSNGISPCRGNSGSPLVLEYRPIQIGINSFGWAEGCELGYPSTYTRVAFYMDWIRRETDLEHLGTNIGF